MVEIAISYHQLPNLESVPFCAATTLHPLELKKHRKHRYQHWPRDRNIGHGRLAIGEFPPGGVGSPRTGTQYQNFPPEREQIRNSSRLGRAPGPWPMLSIWPMLVAMLPMVMTIHYIRSDKAMAAQVRFRIPPPNPCPHAWDETDRGGSPAASIVPLSQVVSRLAPFTV